MKTRINIRPRNMRYAWGDVLLVTGLALLFAQILRYASVSEDAYITFRTIDQFTQGNGLRWNIIDRVQVYTHPLWMLLHIPFYALWENIFLISIGLSLICAAIAIWLPIRTFERFPIISLSVFIVPLMLSRTFVDYSTSGLENTLLHALFAWFGFILLRQREHRYFWFFASLAGALSLTARLDTVILYGPVGVYFLIAQFRIIRWRQIFAGFSPLILWEIFSLFYYGFLFPNTKYVKLDTGLDRLEYLRRGVHYFLNLVAVDILSALWLVIACALIPWLGMRYHRTRTVEHGILFSLSVGVLCYVLYVFYIGGYFVFGKSWSLPVYASIWLVFALAYPSLPKNALIAIAIICCCIKVFYPPLSYLVKQCPACFSTVRMCCDDPKPVNKWLLLSDYMQGKRVLPRVAHKTFFMQTPMMGKNGYRAFSETVILDRAGISDPFIARLPPGNSIIGKRKTSRSPREIPKGYFRAKLLGDDSHMDKDLVLYYSKIRLIIAGDLWDTERLKEIVKFNLGYYEHLRLNYLRRVRKQPPSDDN